MKIQIVIADGRKILREGLRLLLEKHGGFEIVGESSDVQSVQRLIKAVPAQVVLLLATGSTRVMTESIRAIRSADHAPQLIVFASRPEPAAVRDLFAAGASGYLTKDCDSAELVTAIRAVHAGRSYVSHELADSLLTRLLVPPKSGGSVIRGAEQLSERERETLKRIADGESTKTISIALGVSTKSVETYRRRVMEKLGCAGFADLVKAAVREGLTSVEPQHR